MFLLLTWIVGPIMNLINGTHHSCERRKHTFMGLQKYTIIFLSSFEKPFFFGNNLKSQILMTNVSTFHDGHIKCGGLDVTHYHTMGPISFMYRSIFYFSKLLTIGLGSLILYSLFHVDIDQYHPTLIWHNCSQKMLDCAYQTCFKILPKFSKMNLFLCHQSKVHH